MLKQIIHLFPEILSRYPSHSGNALKMMKYITRLVVELLKLVRLRATKNEIDFKHYPILNDRLAFLPNYFNIPYAVHSSNLPQVNITQEMHYLCGSDIENLKGLAPSN